MNCKGFGASFLYWVDFKSNCGQRHYLLNSDSDLKFHHSVELKKNMLLNIRQIATKKEDEKFEVNQDTNIPSIEVISGEGPATSGSGESASATSVIMALSLTSLSSLLRRNRCHLGSPQLATTLSSLISVMALASI